MFHILEPQWWIALLQILNAWMMSSPALMYRIPKLADIFVFTYPVYLLLLYFRGVVSRFRWWTSQTLKRWKEYYKIAAMFVGVSVLVSVVVNLLLQYVFVKVRPNVILWLIDNKTESILHKFLPSSSFPSDHAVVSMSIAMATLLWWLSRKDKRFVWMSIPLFVFSLIMCFCRIAGAIHWPTDIIAGIVLGLIIPLVMLNKKIYAFLEKIFSWVAKKI